MKLARAIAVPLLSVLAMSAFASDGFEPPRYQLVLLGGGSAFRGGQPDSSLSSALPFQPDATSPTGAVALSIRAVGKLRLEAEFATARGRGRDGLDAPNNTFWSGGLAHPWLSLGGGRFVSQLAAGGGIVERRVRDEFQSTVERAFEVRETDPQAYAGVGAEWRITRVFALRADYRYLRVFPVTVEGLDVERSSYGTHRLAGGLTLSY